jgi:hypothetical protein
MTEIKNVEVYGLESTIARSGLPMAISLEEIITTEENSLKRMSKLCNTPLGSGHNNALKGIIVQFDVKYPEYLSPEMQRYHWFEIISSMSKMHRLTKMNLSEKNCNKYVDEKIINIINDYINNYNQEQSYENFMKVVSNCPLGFEKWMAISTNYLQLKTIYHQRKNHKLKEDWGAIIDMIENLPHKGWIIN